MERGISDNKHDFRERRFLDIRYDLGDSVTLKLGACRCGSPLPAIEIKGRCDDVVSLRGGAIRAGRTLRGLARRHRALPRLALTGRVVDVKNNRFGYRLRVRPSR